MDDDSGIDDRVQINYSKRTLISRLPYTKFLFHNKESTSIVCNTEFNMNKVIDATSRASRTFH